MSDERLYGVPHAEELYLDPGAAYEQQVEPYLDHHDRNPQTIEEWTTFPAGHHLPTVEQLTDWIVEHTADCGEALEGFVDQLEGTARLPEVLAAAETLLAAMAAGITYRMADRKVAEHTITWGADDEPLLDGKPLYVKRPAEDVPA